MKSRVMVLEAFNEPLILRNIDIPPLEQGQVLVKLGAAGICGSDVHMWKGEDPRIPLPVIPGHEGVGTVVEVKRQKCTVDGDELNSGDTVIWNRGITCGKCFFCRVAKDPSLCSARRVYGITMPCSEKPYLNGCYAEYIILRAETDIFTVDESIDPAVLVSASCSGATAAHAYDMYHESLVGKTVVVQGPGPLGVYAVAFANSHGASRIIVIGGTLHRLEICKRFGATDLLNRHETTEDERRSLVLDSTHGRGADLVVEAAGSQGAAEEGIRLLRTGGTYLTAGYSQPAGTEKIDFYQDVVNRNIRIQGIWVSDTGHLRQAVTLVSKSPDLFAALVTHRFSLEEANEGITAMREKKALKAVLIV